MTILKFLNVGDRSQFKGALLGLVPTGISGTKTLSRAVANALEFPSYFGENWNSLFDCLMDFHWTDTHRIILVHEDVPRIPSSELKLYLEVLRDAVLDWKRDVAHELVVVFDERDRDCVTNALGK